jgi:ParB family chromosome partitioning protein
MRALTGLKQAGMALQGAHQQAPGRPSEMPLDKIMRDPDNLRPPMHLREPDDQQKQRELNANIKQRGVKSPISLRPHLTIPDMWIINHGHCRYDGAEAAGFATIPYFVDPNFDSYDQVGENLHRADLSPWAIAEFIKRKLEENQSKKQISEGLGKENESYVSEHLALVDAPQCLHQAHRNGVRSVRTLYDLRRAYEEFPEQVEAWCNAAPKITRDTIKELLQMLRTVSDQVTAGDARAQLRQEPTVPEFRHDERNDPPECKATPQLPQKVTEREFRHDEEKTLDVPSNEILHRGKKLPGAEQSQLNESSSRERELGSGVLALYRGLPAQVAPNTTVKIMVEGHSRLLEVPLSELVFTVLSRTGPM